jgi:hypothetical protein
MRGSKGMAAGIITNNGPIDPPARPRPRTSSRPAARPARPCCTCKNTTGFMVGALRRGGMIKHGSKMIQAVTNATVPQITLYVRRLVRRRQLRHVRARLRTALLLLVAQRQDGGDGRRAGGRHDGDRHQAAAAPRKPAQDLDARALDATSARSSSASTAR